MRSAGDALRAVQRGHDGPAQLYRVIVIIGQVISHARQLRMNFSAPQFLRIHFFPRGRFHQRWAAEKDRSGALDDDRLVGHRRHVGPTGCARAHHRRDLRNAFGRQSRLIEENASEVIPVWEYLGLKRQKRTA